MRILPKEEFLEVARTQEFTHPGLMTGFIDKFTFESTIPRGTTTRVKLHELGHEEYGHYPRAIEYYGGRGKSEPWRSKVDDEIEAEIYSFRMMGKKVTPMVGMNAIRNLVGEGYNPQKAFSLVLGRMRKFGIIASYKDRKRIAGILRRSWGVDVQP